MPGTRLNLLDLSDELIFLVHCQIDSLIDLRCFIRSCRAVYRVFEASKAVLVSNVFANALHPAVQEPAMTFALSDHLLQHPGSKSARRALSKLLSSTTPAASHSSTSLTRLLDPGLLHHHSIIESFTSMIARFCFSYAQRRSWCHPFHDTSQAPLSRAETARIQRALYRYDILCTLHQHSLSHPASPTALKGGYINTKYWMHTLTPWEMDEVGCVHDILYSLLGSMMEAFCYAGAVRRGFAHYMEVDQSPDRCRAMAEAWVRPQVMSRGLRLLARLFRARDDVERINLLDELKPPMGFGMNTSAFYQLVSCTYKPVVSVPMTQLQRPPPSTVTVDGVSREDADDNVSGPNSGWYWAVMDADKGKEWKSWCTFVRERRCRRRRRHPVNDGEPPAKNLMAFSRQYYADAHASLRIWGWCFWDGARIREWMAYRAARSGGLGADES